LENEVTGVPGGLWGGLGVAVATASAILYKWIRKSPMSMDDHHAQSEAWVQQINSKLDRLTEIMAVISNGITRQVEIAEDQKETTTKIWERMLTTVGKE
jgi:hypothetical protein